MVQKKIVLTEKVNYNGEEIATLQVNLFGDGATPAILTFGNGMSGVIGYRDDGTVILDENVDRVIEEARTKFMAKAIKEQKKLCVENGIDPELVNILNAEKKVNNE